ncbi:MAG: DUF4405 domain-containing protein [Desulforegulaceae bacterium]|nr:DUF4405 domain-containing protein [Desulforegulaceae bacterium]
MRKTVSLTSLLAFVFVVITSAVLFIVPQGRIAYWADWRLLGLTKEQWEAVHINLGILFIISLFFHIYYNWNSILLYLKNKAREFKVFTPEFNISILVVFIFIGGTIGNFPFFSTIINLSENIKNKAAVKYGEPPYGHAELSTLESFSRRMGLGFDESIILLRSKGFEIHNRSASLKEIARFNKTSPQNLYLSLKTGSSQPMKFENKSKSFFSGKGKSSLVEIAKDYNLNPEELFSYFNKKNLKIDMNLSLRENSEANNMRPLELYKIIVEFSNKK